MNNIWTVALIAIISVFLGYYLSQYFAPLGWIGFLVAFGLVIYYLFNRNKRIQ